MTTSSRSPELSEVLRVAMDAAARRLHVALPGRVLSYDAEGQTADVQVMVKDRSSAAGSASSMPVLRTVPVVFPRAGGFRLSFPVREGDGVLVVFADRAIDRWWSEGVEADPVELRTHHVSDAIAIVGLNDRKHAIEDAPTDYLALGKDDGSVELQVREDHITIKAGSVKLGSDDAAKALALAEKVHSELDTIRSWCEGHQHTGTVDGASCTTTVTTPTPTILPPRGDVSSATASAKD